MPADEGRERPVVPAGPVADEQVAVGQGVEPLPFNEIADVPGDGPGRVYGHDRSLQDTST